MKKWGSKTDWEMWVRGSKISKEKEWKKESERIWEQERNKNSKEEIVREVNKKNYEVDNDCRSMYISNFWRFVLIQTENGIGWNVMWLFSFFLLSHFQVMKQHFLKSKVTNNKLVLIMEKKAKQTKNTKEIYRTINLLDTE